MCHGQRDAFMEPDVCAIAAFMEQVSQRIHTRLKEPISQRCMRSSVDFAASMLTFAIDSKEGFDQPSQLVCAMALDWPRLPSDVPHIEQEALSRLRCTGSGFGAGCPSLSFSSC